MIKSFDKIGWDDFHNEISSLDEITQVIPSEKAFPTKTRILSCSSGNGGFEPSKNSAGWSA